MSRDWVRVIKYDGILWVRCVSADHPKGHVFCVQSVSQRAFRTSGVNTDFKAAWQSPGQYPSRNFSGQPLPTKSRIGVITSLADIQKLCVLALFGIVFQVLLRCANMSSHRGGGYVYVFEICEKRPFQKCIGLRGGGGRWSHFSAKGCTLDGAHEQCTAPLNHVYSASWSPSALPFSGRAGTPLRQTSPCLWTGTYFFNFPQSCNLRALTGTHPSLRGIIHRPSVVRSTFRCLINWTLRELYPDFNHAPAERALLRTKGFWGAFGGATACRVNLCVDMVSVC